MSLRCFKVSKLSEQIDSSSRSSFTCSVNLDSIQSETNSLIKQLKTSESKLLSSSEDMKEQYLSAIQVSQPTLHWCKGGGVCG